MISSQKKLLVIILALIATERSFATKTPTKDIPQKSTEISHDITEEERKSSARKKSGKKSQKKSIGKDSGKKSTRSTVSNVESGFCRFVIDSTKKSAKKTPPNKYGMLSDEKVITESPAPKTPAKKSKVRLENADVDLSGEKTENIDITKNETLNTKTIITNADESEFFIPNSLLPFMSPEQQQLLLNTMRLTRAQNKPVARPPIIREQQENKISYPPAKKEMPISPLIQQRDESNIANQEEESTNDYISTQETNTNTETEQKTSSLPPKKASILQTLHTKFTELDGANLNAFEKLSKQKDIKKDIKNYIRSGEPFDRADPTFVLWAKNANAENRISDFFMVKMFKLSHILEKYLIVQKYKDWPSRIQKIVNAYQMIRQKQIQADENLSDKNHDDGKIYKIDEEFFIESVNTGKNAGDCPSEVESEDISDIPSEITKTLDFIKNTNIVSKNPNRTKSIIKWAIYAKKDTYKRVHDNWHGATDAFRFSMDGTFRLYIDKNGKAIGFGHAAVSNDKQNRSVTKGFYWFDENGEGRNNNPFAQIK